MMKAILRRLLNFVCPRLHLRDGWRICGPVQAILKCPCAGPCAQLVTTTAILFVSPTGFAQLVPMSRRDDPEARYASLYRVGMN